jgi:serine/threonine-protein kinase
MSPQESIAHYRIVSKLGEGGMGEVWRATDTKLNRDVAVKVLPESFASDLDRMARFEREAQVLASLNHPNIAAIYGVEQAAIVMELVEGPTLAERIAAGMSVDDVLPILHQLVDALEYAHEKNVVHRDLKPANVKITPEGRVKVLDFGLAKAMVAQAETGEFADSVSSPTLTMRATIAGTLMGTAAYMAPEQARGQNVDKRADIWAFGVVVYEMLASRQLFAGLTISDTLAAVLKEEPEWERIPPHLRRLLRSCLQKDPRQRLRDIGDARTLMEGPAHPASAPVRRTIPIWAAAVLTLTLLVTGAFLWRATRPVDHPLVRLSVDLGPEATPGLNLTIGISPDGRRLVFPARGPDGKQQLATRLLDQAQATLLPGTEGGRDPFFEPDGQWIGFVSGTQLKKISVQGGAPVTVGNAVTSTAGASWGEDGNIILTTGNVFPLSRIPAAGGVMQPLTRLGAGEATHRWPQILSGGDAVLFTASSSATAVDNANVEAISLKTGKVKILQRGGYYGRYLPSGHLVYLHQGVLFGVRFDLGRLEVRGTPVPLLEDVAANSLTGGGQFDFSSTGTFVYAAGKSAVQTWQITWLDSSGKMQPLILAPGAYANPRFSPDGRKLAFLGSDSDIHVHDLERDTTTHLTFLGGLALPVWTPDGRDIVFTTASGLFWIHSDGAGEPQRLLESPNLPRAYSFSPDGRRLAYLETSPETGLDIWTLPVDLSDPGHPKTGKPEPFLRTPADETVPRFSPDGRWIAYRSNESGSPEIYVRPFSPASGGKWQISSGGGLYPCWSGNGRELFYETTDNRIMVVEYTVDGASFAPGKRRLWTDKELFYTGTTNLDLAPDGKRFAVLASPEGTPGEKGNVHVIMLQNFFDELRRRIP